MSIRSGIVLITIAALLVSACSEEKKREAARLAAQLDGDSTLVTASIDSTSLAADDSMLADSLHESPATIPDTSRQVTDSPIIAEQQATTPAETTLTAESNSPANQTQDSVIPDINAIPTENGQAAPKSMPRYIENAYTVQVASSTEQAFSQQIVDTFLARGYDAYLGTVTRDGTTYYRVRVGHYATPTEANRTAVEINQKYSLQAWVDKITK